MTDAIPVSIRLAQVPDAADIAALTTQLGYHVPTSTVADRLARMLPKSDQQFLVAEVQGDIVGWVHVTLTEYVESGLFAVIGGLVVDRHARQKGIGRALMARAEEWARSQGCSLVRLWSSTIRAESHRFYEHLGYANIKTQFTFVKAVAPDGEDAIRGFIPQIGR